MNIPKKGFGCGALRPPKGLRLQKLYAWSLSVELPQAAGSVGRKSLQSHLGGKRRHTPGRLECRGCCEAQVHTHSRGVGFICSDA